VLYGVLRFSTSAPPWAPLAAFHGLLPHDVFVIIASFLSSALVLLSLAAAPLAAAAVAASAVAAVAVAFDLSPLSPAAASLAAAAVAASDGAAVAFVAFFERAAVSDLAFLIASLPSLASAK